MCYLLRECKYYYTHYKDSKFRIIWTITSVRCTEVVFLSIIFLKCLHSKFRMLTFLRAFVSREIMTYSGTLRKLWIHLWVRDLQNTLRCKIILKIFKWFDDKLRDIEMYRNFFCCNISFVCCKASHAVILTYVKTNIKPIKTLFFIVRPKQFSSARVVTKLKR